MKFLIERKTSGMRPTMPTVLCLEVFSDCVRKGQATVRRKRSHLATMMWLEFVIDSVRKGDLCIARVSNLFFCKSLAEDEAEHVLGETPRSWGGGTSNRERTATGNYKSSIHWNSQE